MVTLVISLQLIVFIVATVMAYVTLVVDADNASVKTVGHSAMFFTVAFALLDAITIVYINVG